jgi:mono/diheme cytochrome c family protein
MYNQSRFVPGMPLPYSGLPPENTLPMNWTPDDPNVVERVSPPFPVTLAVIQRGQERFEIYCTPCHGQLGDGNGMVALRGFPHPPTYHQPSIRSLKLGQMYDVINRGFGIMPRYGDRTSVSDRWAIALYVRALQRSQDATLKDVPAGVHLP